ncbi:hypothetical protein NVS89_04515 [Ancylobacter sp. MQZ15Z-1]|uniref:Uncharacterized protein n=1 Tax=Ancylobacter mangrovi TaxID=2972472 RepID=A0A9X2PAH7_9HYPH|nr:hypothetical protein [Ancylobacter mangrovi]MCS0494350.1 hypothetical protein [Ancylobacter mangrovi]
MSIVPKLTTVAACRVVGIDRDRFNEHVAAGRFDCAPATIPGRARLFDPDDMISLCLFRDLMNDGLDAAHAGYIACAVGRAARANPDAKAICFVRGDNGRGSTTLPENIPPVDEWETFRFSGTRIRNVTTYNVHDMRERIAHGTDEERSIIGPED